MGYSTDDIRHMYDLADQYSVYGKWLTENGFTKNDLPLTAETELGENVIVDGYADDEGKWVWKIATLQDNGWLRVKHFHDDHRIEEMYER